MSLYHKLRPLIYQLSPEQAHHLTLNMLKLAGSRGLPAWVTKRLLSGEKYNQPVSVMGLDFPNVLGLAAGYDKDAEVYEGLACLGFGHIEVGTVTPKAQPGNPQPRLFRLVEDQAIINRMGFNNNGAQEMAGSLSKRRTKDWILGVNIGKNKITPNEEAAADYQILVKTLAPFADYLVVNVSSPNTPGLRDLLARDHLDKILNTVQQERQSYFVENGRRVPLVLKLSPDLNGSGLDDALQCALDQEFDGVIVTNTTLRRDGVSSALAGETGGLSGKPLAELSLEVLAATVRKLDGKMPVIASGGVMVPNDIQKRLDAGAALVQLYSGLIYYGPTLVRDGLRQVKN